MKEVDFEVRQIPDAELADITQRSNRMNKLREKMKALQHGQYVYVPKEVFEHGALRQAVHRISGELARGRFRCMKYGEGSGFRVLFLG